MRLHSGKRNCLLNLLARHDLFNCYFFAVLVSPSLKTDNRALTLRSGISSWITNNASIFWFQFFCRPAMMMTLNWFFLTAEEEEKEEEAECARVASSITSPSPLLQTDPLFSTASERSILPFCRKSGGRLHFVSSLLPTETAQDLCIFCLLLGRWSFWWEDG